MEVHFTPDVQAKIERMAKESGREPDEVVQDAVAGLFDEMAQVGAMLDRRYDEMERGEVEGIDGEEAFRRLMERTQQQRRSE